MADIIPFPKAPEPTDGDGEGPTEIVVRVVFEWPDEPEEPEGEDWHLAEVLPRKAPTLWQVLCEEAGSSSPRAVARHVTSAYGDWEELLMSWRDEAAQAASSALNEQEALHLVAIVTAKALAPQIANAKFLNYQVKLDANLRAVMRELRETQRHRLAMDAAVVAEG
jgi:hypothetical protein